MYGKGCKKECLPYLNERKKFLANNLHISASIDGHLLKNILR